MNGSDSPALTVSAAVFTRLITGICRLFGIPPGLPPPARRSNRSQYGVVAVSEGPEAVFVLTAGGEDLPEGVVDPSTARAFAGQAEARVVRGPR